MDEPEEAGREAWTLLFQLFRSQRRDIAALYREFDLNPAQAHLILNLDPNSGVPMNEAAEALACDASYITGLVDRLERRGLVQRAAAPQDRRIKLIVLTPEGTKVRRGLVKGVSEPPPFIATMSPDDQQVLRDIFRRAVSTVQAPPLPSHMGARGRPKD